MVIGFRFQWPSAVSGFKFQVSSFKFQVSGPNISTYQRITYQQPNILTLKYGYQHNCSPF